MPAKNNIGLEKYFDNGIKYFLFLFFLTCAFSVSLSEIGFFGAFFIWLLKVIYVRKVDWKKNPADLPLFLFALFTLGAVFIGLDASRELLNRFKPLSLLLIYPLIVANLKDKKTVKEFLLLALFSVLVQSVIIIVMGFTTSNLARGEGIGGTMSVTLTAGEIIATLLGFAVCFFVSSEKSKSRYYFLLVLLAGLAALLLTLARGAWVSFLFTAFIFALLWNKKVFLLLVVFLLILGAGLVVNKNNIFVRKAISTFDTSRGTTPIRFELWKSGLLMLKNNPLGLGIDNVYKNSGKPPYRIPISYYSTYGHLHNNYLQLAVERGIQSLLVFLWLFFVFLRTALAGYLKTKDKEAKYIFLGIFLALAAFMIGGVFEYGLGSAIYAPIVWALAGIGMVFSKIVEQKKWH